MASGLLPAVTKALHSDSKCELYSLLSSDAGETALLLLWSPNRSPETHRLTSWLVERAGRETKLAFKAHPHMLRHACGYTLANKGHDTRALQAYLGHRNIQHTVRYTELSPARFKDFWRE
jgi:site-specific recombinase XerD